MKKIIVLITTLMFISCNLFNQEESRNKSTTSTFMIDISSTDRTIRPDIDITQCYHVISFSGDISVDPITVESTNSSISLENGEWTISVSSYDGSDILVATGESVISLPTDDSVSICMDYIINETGDIDIDLSYSLPTGVTIGSITSYLKDLESEVITNLTVNQTESPVNISGSVSSGYYLFMIDFNNGNGDKLVPYSDIIHIYDNLTTEAQIIISEDEFLSIPENPINLSYIETGDAVILEWDDPSTNETSFIVEKDGVQIAELLGSNITQYTDTDVSDGETYTYVVKTKNSNGTSSGSDGFSVTVSNETRVLYVTEIGDGDGLTWETAMGDLQEAINRASTYGRKPVLWVAEGTYTPSMYPIKTDAVSRNKHFSLAPGVSIYGGFAGTESFLDERVLGYNTTILSADIDDDDYFGDNYRNNYQDNAYNIFYHTASLGLLGTEIIDNVTISNAYDYSNNTKGAGIYHEGAKLTINNCIFENNRAEDYGGAIYIAGDIEINNSVFYNNNASRGGAISTSSSQFKVNVSNSIFYGNISNDGGAMYLNNDDVNIINCSIISNTSSGPGGIRSYNGFLNIYNTIFWDNYGDQGYENINTFTSGTFTIIRSIVEDYDLTTGERYDGDFHQDIITDGILFADIDNPMGADEKWFTTDDGLMLLDSSSGIDSGDNQYISSGLDIIGNIRILSETVDIGAYENPYSDDAAPEAVSDLTAEAVNSAVKLSWGNTLGYDNYRIAITWSPETISDQPHYLTKDSNTVTITDLDNDSEYTFNVVNTDYAGNQSDLISITTTPNLLEINDVINMDLYVSNQRVFLFWEEPENSIYEEFEVILYSDGEIFDTITTTNTSYVMDELINDNSYDITVSVVDYGNAKSSGVTKTFTPSGRVYVDDDSGNLGDGSSWLSAKNNLSLVLDNAADNTEIWVAEGLYIPSTTPALQEETLTQYYHFAYSSIVELYGGFDGSESNLEERDFVHNRTILSGDHFGDDVISGSGNSLEINNNNDNSIHVFYNPYDYLGSDLTDCVLDGFIITGGNANLDMYTSDHGHGGGIYLEHFIPKIQNIDFIGNSASGYGGGLYSTSSIDLIKNLVFDRNVANRGGGMYSSRNNRLHNSVFSGNRARYGGAISAGSDSEYVNLTIIGNYASTRGGGMDGYSSLEDTIIDNSIFVNNRSAGSHEDIYSDDSYGQPYINNSLYNHNNVTAYSTYNYNDEGFLFVDLYNGVGEDNIWKTADDGYQLIDGSVGIDGGVATNVDESTDVYFNIRIQGSGVDLGAYESEFSDSVAPEEVTNLTLNVVDGTVTLAWDDSTSPDFQNVEILWEDSETNLITTEKNIGDEVATYSAVLVNDNYAFTVKTVDINGNRSIGIEIDNSHNPISITLNGPADESFDISDIIDNEIYKNTQFEVSVTEGFDSYRWYIDGVKLSQTTFNITVDCRELTIGKHLLMCVIESGNNFYSKNIQFEISNN